MRRDNVFFAVDKALVSSVFRGFVDLVNESCNSGFRFFFLCLVELQKRKYDTKRELSELTSVNIRCDWYASRNARVFSSAFT